MKHCLNYIILNRPALEDLMVTGSCHLHFSLWRFTGLNLNTETKWLNYLILNEWKLKPFQHNNAGRTGVHYILHLQLLTTNYLLIKHKRHCTLTNGFIGIPQPFFILNTNTAKHKVRLDLQTRREIQFCLWGGKAFSTVRHFSTCFKTTTLLRRQYWRNIGV